MLINIQSNAYEVKPVLGRYGNGRVSIQLVIKETYEPLLTCTVNLPDHPLKKEEAFIKNWSENKGVLRWMKKNNLIKEIIGYQKTGYVKAPKVKLNMKKLKEKEE